jgi:hypothetical protein
MSMHKNFLALIVSGCVIASSSLWAMEEQNIADLAAEAGAERSEEKWNAVLDMIKSVPYGDPRLNVVDTQYQQQTALMWAVNYQNEVVAEALLAQGADASFRAPNGLTALDIAQPIGNSRIIEQLQVAQLRATQKSWGDLEMFKKPPKKRSWWHWGK